MLNSLLSLRKDSEQDNGHSSGLDQRKWYSISEDSSQGECDEWDNKGWKDDGDTRCERMSNFPCYDSVVQRSTQKKQRTRKIVDTSLCRIGADSNCFSHTCFCQPAQSWRGSRRRRWILSRWNGETRCERTIEFLVCAKCDQTNMPFEWWWWSFTYRISIAKIRRTNWKSNHNKTDWAKFVWMQDSRLQLTSDSISSRKTVKDSHNLQNQWLVVGTLCQETKIRLNRRVGSEGTPNWTRIGSCNQWFAR